MLCHQLLYSNHMYNLVYIGVFNLDTFTIANFLD